LIPVFIINQEGSLLPVWDVGEIAQAGGNLIYHSIYITGGKNNGT
jgi:hypothetical protein